MLVIAQHQKLLRQLGLDTMEGVKRFNGELIKNHKGRRDIFRIRPRYATDGPPLIFYLKRNWKPYKKDGLHSLLTRSAVWSQSRVEWENSLALQRAGLTVAEPVAFGEECGPLWEKFSFIITAEARGEMTLDGFLRTIPARAERRRVLDTLAGEVRRLHDAGLASPDLFTRHIFLAAGLEPKFCLIDMARMDRQQPLGARLRARDLAALHVTAPLRFVSARERLRFMAKYGGDGELIRLVQQRARHLLQRKKFADYAVPGTPS